VVARLCISRSLLVAAVCAVLAGSAAAQPGRVGGTIKDESGQPIKGATVMAEFLDANVSTVTGTTDEKGRFAMVGLRFGEWMFTVQAPGFIGQHGNMNVRTIGINPPLAFTLRKTFVPPSALGSISPKDVQAALAVAEGLYNNGKWDEAIAAYRAVLAQAPVLSVVHLQIAAAFRNKKEFDGAIAAYNDLLRIDPDNIRAKVGIAMTNFDKGDLQVAERALEAATKSPTADREVFYSLGEVERAKSDTEAAANAYERALQLDPSWGKPAFALGQLAMSRSDTATAVKQFQLVVTIDPTSAEAAEAKTLLAQIK